MIVKCNQCGKEFSKSRSEIKRMKKRKWNRYFCNVKCLSKFGISLRKDNIQKQINEYYKNPKLCLNCNSVINYKDKSWKIYCSTKCSLFIHKRRWHCHWSDEGKKKLSMMAKSNPKFCGWNRGLQLAKVLTVNCIICNKLFTKKESLLKHRVRVCSKKCLSKIQSLNLLNQYKNGKSVYGGTTKWLKYKNIKVQGSYEYRTCIILDRWKELNKIKNWKYTPDRFEYVGMDNKKHNYLIDFKIWNNDNSFYYIETKGYEKENDKLKWKSVRDRGYKLEVWFDDDIKMKEKEFMVSISITG